jgi:branched-chain amino acid transport system ATP-binding protein
VYIPIPIFLVEQNLSFAKKFADYTHVMSKGKIVHSSTPAELWENREVKERYLGVWSCRMSTFNVWK